MLRPEHSATLDSLVASYRDMRFLQRQRIRAGNSAMAYVRRLCGFTVDMDEKQRAEVIKRARALCAGKAPDDDLASRVDELMDANEVTILPITAMEKQLIKDIVKAVEKLPIWTEWADAIPGIGPKGVAIIIGEAGGDPGAFRSEAALWRRMGVGIVDGIAQGKLPKTASKEEWITHGYSAKRRSALYTIGAAIIKCTDSPYRAIYLARKEFEAKKLTKDGFAVLPAAKITDENKATSISKGHIDRRAQRYMEKRLLRHFYKAWKRTMYVSGPAATKRPPRDAANTKAPLTLVHTV